MGGANVYREQFSKELANTIHGTVKASPEEWGETLEQEQLRGGSFLEQDQVSSDAWQRLLELEVGNNKHKLFGGAQYHRALREFTVAVRHMHTPLVTEDEIANAAGVGDVHDGVNFMRAACVIAVEKAQQSFEPMLEALRHRSTHIMRRLYPVVEQIIRKNGINLPLDSYNRPFKDLIHRVYDKFVDEQISLCLSKCRDDMGGMTRFVTWDVDGQGGSPALYKSLPTPKKMVEIYSVAVDNNSGDGSGSGKDSSSSSSKRGRKEHIADKVTDEWAAASGSSVSVDSVAAHGQIVSSQFGQDDAQASDYFDLLQLTEEMLAGRNAGRTNTVVTALVQYIIRSWRDHYARTVAMKFNCFFLMPFLDEFPAYLRKELDDIYSEDSDVGEMFDIQEARNALQQRRTELEAECAANSKLQRRFDMINAQLRNSADGDAVNMNVRLEGGLESSEDSDSREQVNINFMTESPNFGRWNKQGQTMEDI